MEKSLDTTDLAILIAAIALMVSLISYFTINKRIEEKIRMESSMKGNVIWIEERRG
jgi:hypothetical protein